MNQSSIGLKGQVKVDVVDHTGKVVREGHWQPNLILDHGLDTLADVSICDMFAVAVKGNDTIAMRETVLVGDTFTLDVVNGRLHRVANAGGRVLNTSDIGKLVHPVTGSGSGGAVVPGNEAVITGLMNAGSSAANIDVATVRQVGSQNPLVAWGAAKSVIFWTVNPAGLDGNQLGNPTGLATELGRTSEYSAQDVDNFTTTTKEKRVLQRTFLFDNEPSNIETGFSGSWASTGTTVTKIGGRAFVGGPDPATSDVGKYIEFLVAGVGAEYCKITSITDATHAVVDRNPIGIYTGVPFQIYGFNKYSHVGLSDTMTVGNNLNVMVRLNLPSGAASPVYALGSNPETPGQQVKLIYNLQVTFGPTTAVALLGSDAFFGDTTVMSTNRNGSYVLEAIESSVILPDGTADLSNVALEPYAGGSVALSSVSDPLYSVSSAGTTGPPDRAPGAQSVPITVDPYTDGSFSRTSVGVFGINDGIGANWHSMGIFDENNQQFLLTWLWGIAQNKPGTHQFALHFRKSWNRDLS